MSISINHLTSVVDAEIGRKKKILLPTKGNSSAVWKLAQRYKRICMENLYTWKTMDQDLLEEAAKTTEGKNVIG
tara:strand:- start:8145 stop:8366 length:222 start_codon:yes stop_codon:yes gene_type:complete